MSGDGREIEILGVLGSGGFGTVYLANLHGRDRFVRRVAVKVLKEGVDQPEIAARQRDEARLLGLLAHECIVQVLELTAIGGRPAVVMDYVQGVDLARVLEAVAAQPADPGRGGAGGVPVRAVLEAGRAVASALEAAWSGRSPVSGEALQVVHRDIKPGNILLTAGGAVKVLDFGIARGNFLRDSRTGSGLWGTPRFMAPELWQGAEAGPAVDTFALGITLLDLLAGGRLERPTGNERSFREEVARRLDGLPAEARGLIAQMVDWNPDARPTHARACAVLSSAVDQAAGESLAGFAARVVPGLLARPLPPAPADAAGLPPRITLDPPRADPTGAFTPAGGARSGTFPPSIGADARSGSPPSGSPPSGAAPPVPRMPLRPLAVGGAVLGFLAIALLGTLIAGWWAMPDRAGGPPASAQEADPAGAAAEAGTAEVPKEVAAGAAEAGTAEAGAKEVETKAAKAAEPEAAETKAAKAAEPEAAEPAAEPAAQPAAVGAGAPAVVITPLAEPVPVSLGGLVGWRAAVDGRALGVLPQQAALLPGTHTVRVEPPDHPDYVRFRAVSCTVTVGEGTRRVLVTEAGCSAR